MQTVKVYVCQSGRLNWKFNYIALRDVLMRIFNSKTKISVEMSHLKTTMISISHNDDDILWLNNIIANGLSEYLRIRCSSGAEVVQLGLHTSGSFLRNCGVIVRQSETR